MNKTVNLSLQDSLLRELDELAQKESRSRSELIREAARMYVERRRQWADIFSLGNQVRRKRRITPEIVSRQISEHRKGR
jgi:CopG family transcriptional regulator/antitoxin EndoAI